MWCLHLQTHLTGLILEGCIFVWTNRLLKLHFHVCRRWEQRHEHENKHINMNFSKVLQEWQFNTEHTCSTHKYRTEPCYLILSLCICTCFYLCLCVCLYVLLHLSESSKWLQKNVFAQAKKKSWPFELCYCSCYLPVCVCLVVSVCVYVSVCVCKPSVWTAFM